MLRYSLVYVKTANNKYGNGNYAGKFEISVDVVAYFSKTFGGRIECYTAQLGNTVRVI